jgi:preprotein translocase subunit YajC
VSGIEFLPLVVIALLFWLLVIRPQSRRARELRNLQQSLSVGDEVMLTSGIVGTVRGLDDEHAMVEVAAGTTIKVVRGAVGTVTPADRPTSTDEPTHDSVVLDKAPHDEKD